MYVKKKDLRYIGDGDRKALSHDVFLGGLTKWEVLKEMASTCRCQYASDLPHLSAYDHVLVQHLEMLIECRLAMESLLLLAGDLINLSPPDRRHCLRSGVACSCFSLDNNHNHACPASECFVTFPWHQMRSTNSGHMHFQRLHANMSVICKSSGSRS